MTLPLEYRPLDPDETVHLLGTGIFIADAHEAAVISPELIGFDPRHPEVVTYKVVEATKYSVIHGIPAFPCPPTIDLPAGATAATCTRMPPYNDDVPVPSTVFGQASAMASARVVEHRTEAAAVATISRGVAPTGFWLLKTDDGRFVTVEVGIGVPTVDAG